MKQHRIARRIVCLLAVLTCLFGCTFGASAEIFTSFNYGTDDEAAVAPDAVNYTKTIDSLSLSVPLGSITDLYFDRDDRQLYALDQTGNQILRMTPQGQVLTVIKGFQNGKIADTFNAPTGLFVDSDNHLYVADTENQRVVELDEHDKLVQIIDLEVIMQGEVSTVLGKDFQFKPTHLVKDSIGRFYLTSTGFNQGVLCLDEEGKFLNCTGTPDVDFDFVQYLWKMISTEAQKDRMDSFVPTEYTNIAIDGEDFLFVSSSNFNAWNFIGDTTYLLRRLNAKGEDIVEADNGFKPYGLRRYTRNGTYAGGALYEDVISMRDGMFAAVDRTRGRVFVYNSESQLLFEFGTAGEYAGAFRKAAALEWDGDTFYVADADKHCIYVYTCNDYGKLLMSTAALHQAGEYEAEEKIWNKVMTYNANSNVALIGMANMEYRNGDYKASMEHFKTVDLTEDYSKVFKAYRLEVLNDYSTWIVLALVAVAVLIVVVFKLYKRHINSDDYHPGAYEASLEFGRKLVLRPLSRYWDLTWEKKGTMAAAMTFLGLTELIMVWDAYGSGYIFSGKSVMLTSPVTVLLKVPLLLFLYCICNWCVTSLMDGKGTFKNIVMANCYALIPLIILMPLCIILSNFITADEGSFYNMLLILAYVWMFILILCANRQIHDYSMGKSVGTILLTLLVMVIVVYLFVLFMVLMQQMVTFVTSLLQDALDQFA